MKFSDCAPKLGMSRNFKFHLTVIEHATLHAEILIR